MDADPTPLVVREPLEHAVVEVDEAIEECPRGVELDREPALGEVDLDGVRTLLEAAPDVELRLSHQIVEELRPRVTLDPVCRVQEAERRGRDDSLLERMLGLLLRQLEVRIGVRPVAERSRGQARQLARVTVGERDRDTVGRERREARDA